MPLQKNGEDQEFYLAPTRKYKKKGEDVLTETAEPEHKELSDILVSEDFSIENILASLSESNSKLSKGEQKQAAMENLAQMQERIKELSYETLQMEIKKREADKKFKQTDYYKSMTKLKRDITKNKKTLMAFSAIFMGKLDMLKDLGVQLSADDIKELKRLADAASTK